MCKKRVHICYKGKEMEECCNSRVEEAVAHRTYVFILIIAVALLIVSLTVKTSCDKVFVDQISFASTITSIILSVIAIWMSISGERGTNEIKTKVSDSVNQLIKSTSESMDLSDELRTTLTSQNLKYEEISKKMEMVINNIAEMKESVDVIGSSLGTLGNVSESDKNQMNEENLKVMVRNTLNGFNDNEGGRWGKQLLLKGMTFVYDGLKNTPQVKPSELLNYLKGDDPSETNAAVITGIIMTFSKNGVFKKVDRKEFNV